MGSVLDYSKLIALDAEELAEGGIKAAYDSLAAYLSRYVSSIADVRESINYQEPSYTVQSGGQEYVIHSPELPDDAGESWGRATYALFQLVNAQLTKSEYRFYAINGGND